MITFLSHICGELSDIFATLPLVLMISVGCEVFKYMSDTLRQVE